MLYEPAGKVVLDAGFVGPSMLPDAPPEELLPELLLKCRLASPGPRVMEEILTSCDVYSAARLLVLLPSPRCTALLTAQAPPAVSILLFSQYAYYC
jgi:hypothetical protein